MPSYRTAYTEVQKRTVVGGGEKRLTMRIYSDMMRKTGAGCFGLSDNLFHFLAFIISLSKTQITYSFLLTFNFLLFEPIFI